MLFLTDRFPYLGIRLFSFFHSYWSERGTKRASLWWLTLPVPMGGSLLLGKVGEPRTVRECTWQVHGGLHGLLGLKWLVISQKASPMVFGSSTFTQTFLLAYTALSFPALDSHFNNSCFSMSLWKTTSSRSPRGPLPQTGSIFPLPQSFDTCFTVTCVYLSVLQGSLSVMGEQGVCSPYFPQKA